MYYVGQCVALEDARSCFYFIHMRHKASESGIEKERKTYKDLQRLWWIPQIE